MIEVVKPLQFEFAQTGKANDVMLIPPCLHSDLTYTIVYYRYTKVYDITGDIDCATYILLPMRVMNLKNIANRWHILPVIVCITYVVNVQKDLYTLRSVVFFYTSNRFK